MENIAQIGIIANNLKTSSKKAIKAFHKFVFQEEGDRQNRKRLREFRGFSFASNSAEHEAKLSYADTHLSLADLIAICNILAIDYAGTKKELGHRICNGLIDLTSLVNNDTEEEGSNDDAEDEGENIEEEVNSDNKEDEDEDNANDNTNDEPVNRNENITNKTKFSMTFKDIEDSFKKFNGDDKYPITAWIQDFEEAAELFQWSELQKLVFAKKSLRGLARLFVQDERDIALLSRDLIR